jgi:preprotein translocase subunit SecY
MVQMVGDDLCRFSCSSASISLSRTFNSSAALCITYSTLLVKINYLSVLTLARFSYLAITTGLLTLGAVILNWICEKITEAGFGE